MGKKLEISIMLFLPPATKIIKLSGFQVLVLLNLVGDLSGLLEGNSSCINDYGLRIVKSHRNVGSRHAPQSLRSKAYAFKAKTANPDPS